MKLFTDQMNREITLGAFPPQRIVSLVPSQTELLYDLGLGPEVVGITKFCVHPEQWFREKTRIGGTKTVHLEKVAALKPDLIIGNKEENDREQIEALATRFPVWMSDVLNLEDALEMISRVGDIVGKREAAQDLKQQIETAFQEYRVRLSSTCPKVAYFIWRKPYMVAGSGTFIDALLQEAGFENVFAQQQRYPEILLEDLTAAQPDIILLSSEPYPFAEKHFGPFREVCPKVEIKIVDGEMFSWYGSRLLRAPAYFEQMRASLDRN